MAARHPSHQPSRRQLTVIAIIVVALAMAGIGVGGVWNLIQSLNTQTVTIPEPFPADELRPPAPEPAPPAASDPVADPAVAQNILLLGSDTRGAIGGSILDIRGQRSDTMMVVHISADRQGVYVMSILRDSWLEIPGHGQAKINAALSWGGVPLAVQTVEGLIGSRIDHVAIVDFAGFAGVTDALGGVDIDNPIAFRSYHLRGHTFAEGPLHLTGAEALAFARERYAFVDGDFQRVRNQQLVIKALLGRLLSAETFLDPGKVVAVFSAAAPYLAADDGLTVGYMAGLALELRELRAGDVTFFTMPTRGTGTSANGQSIVNIDWDKLAVVRQAFQTDTLHTYQPEHQTIG